MINVERKDIHEDGSFKQEVFSFNVVVSKDKIKCSLASIEVYEKTANQRKKRLVLELHSYRTDDKRKIDDYVKDEGVLIDAHEALQEMIHVSF